MNSIKPFDDVNLKNKNEFFFWLEEQSDPTNQ